MSQQEDFFSHYLRYTSNMEPPAIFNRWALITAIGAFLGRQYYFEHGHFHVNPNMYTMLMGTPGSRKSTAIKLVRKLIVEAGYTNIAADKSTKEKFLLDLAGEDDEPSQDVDILDKNLFGAAPNLDREIFITADEFNDFFGNGNIEFISLLGTLWDYSGVYKNRIKTGKSVSIHNPTVSILGGNTPTGFSLAFPPEIIGQGFFSRILLIYGESSGRQITFPKRPSPEDTAFIVGFFREIKARVMGCAQLTPNAEKLCDRIYRAPSQIDDVRFESYRQRRLTHLLKLALITSATRLSTTIGEEDILYANTVLSYAELFMPKALGQFGKAKNSDVAHKVYSIIHSQDKLWKLGDIWEHVHNDLESLKQLVEVLSNLTQARKIQIEPKLGGWLPVRKVIDEQDLSMVDYSLLSEEERSVKL